MKRSFLLLLSLALAACQQPTAPAAPQLTPEGTAVLVQKAPGKGIKDRYIVVFNDNVTDVPGLAHAMQRAHGGTLLYIYESALKGFAIEIPAGLAAALAKNPNVVLVEEDQEMSLDATQTGATWGIDRIDQTSLPLNGTYVYNTTASNVYAYIIDTGIRTAHSQFVTNGMSRASNVYDALGGNGQDCNGHGTHVAGTVGGNTHGVAKGVRLRGLRVLNCSGSGSTSGIIAAIDWVRQNHVKPAVANLSLGGGYSSALNTAINNLASAGVFVAVAAGNESQNACNVSPASAANATTVAASDRTDTRASFSNYGSCVNIYAPGVSITSTWHTSNTATNTISGTSMASPHVAGAAALYKARYGDASYSTIRSWMVNNASANVIRSNVTGTPNRLLFKSTL
jgi:subtilisin family serine protease